MKTSKAHFEIFKKECEKWIKLFGLSNWEISIEHSKGDSDRAWIIPVTKGRVVRICLGSNWINLEPDKITPDMLKRVAFHEVCEVLIEPLAWLAECRFLNPDQLDPARHDIIHRLEEVIFK